MSDLTDVILIDGGFVSNKPLPRDVDIVLGLRPGTITALQQGALGIDSVAALALLEGKLSDPVDEHQPIHGFADDVGGPKYEGMRQFFQLGERVDEPRVKGILRLQLKK